MRQADIAAPLTKSSSTSGVPDSRWPGDVAGACRTALSGRPGPVHLSFPADTLESPAGEAGIRPRQRDFAGASRRRHECRQAPMLDAACAWRAGPVILAGPAGLTRRGRARLAALEDGVRHSGRRAWRARAAWPIRAWAFAEMLLEADCVLLLGKRLDFTLQVRQVAAFGALRLPADRRGCRRRSTLARAVGGGSSAYGQVADACVGDRTRSRSGAHAQDARSTWRDEVRAAIEYRPGVWGTPAPGRGRLHPVQLLRPLQALLDEHPDSVLVVRRRRDRPVGAGVPDRAAPRHQRRGRVDRSRAAVREWPRASRCPMRR